MIESSTVLSPNGQWIALTEVLLPASAPSDQYHRQLRVLRADRLQEWVAIDEWSNYGLGYPVPVVVHWSPDGAAMFFADQAVPDGCGAAYLWNYRRLDLASGEVAATLEGGGHAYAFAPTTSALAVGSTEAGQPVLRVTNGTITAPHALTLVLPMDYRIEQIAWSEDEGSLILASVAGDSACGGDALPPRTYLRVDLVDAAQTVLLADDRRGLQLQGWSGADRLVLSDAAGQQWVMDANTGVLTQRP